MLGKVRVSPVIKGNQSLPKIRERMCKYVRDGVRFTQIRGREGGRSGWGDGELNGRTEGGREGRGMDGVREEWMEGGSGEGGRNGWSEGVLDGGGSTGWRREGEVIGWSEEGREG